MSDSPLQFTRDFDRLKASLAVIHTPDTRLLLLTDFWPKLKEALEYKSFSSYLDEYFPLFLQPVSETDLGDLRIEELRSIIDRLSDIAKSGDADPSNAGFTNSRAKIYATIHQTVIALAKKLFYIGEIEAGLEICRNIVESRPSSEPDLGRRKNPTLLSPPEFRQEGVPDGARMDGGTPPTSEISEIERFRQVRDDAKDSSPELFQLLTTVLIEWESILESLTTDGANCLFVEKDGAGQAFRGRMMTLEGNVELFGKSAEKDEITFQNQIKTPDDPFIGVAYDALEAVRRLLSGKKYAPCAADLQICPSDDIVSRLGSDPPQAEKNPTSPSPVIKKGSRRAGKSGPFYHAHFTILNSKQTFTGNSIGLAFALITYTQLLKPEIMRQERFLPSDVAFTGGVDNNGLLTTVNEDTLRLKIERAFFSPMKFVVAPSGNFASAKGFIEEFRRKYPRRNLRLISAESLNEIFEDRNVIRSERVCAGRYIARKASRYTRSVKIQIPILLALLYAAVCLIYPKAWWGFDENPAYYSKDLEGVNIFNSAGDLLWSKTFNCSLDTATTLPDIGDLDGDGQSEVAIMPGSMTEDCPIMNRVFVYSSKGELLFERICTIQGKYPGDDSTNLRFTPNSIGIIDTGNGGIIVTTITRSEPARTHIRFWSSRGDSLAAC